jgi:hypothetical protein
LSRKAKEKVLKAVRVNPDTWNKALGKARARGMTMEQLIDRLLKGFNANKINVKGVK